MTIEIFGWLGAFFFAICCLPQVILCVKNGNANGISKLYLLMWFLGEILTIIYVYPKHDIPLMVNYGMNLVFLIIIAKYKYYPK